MSNQVQLETELGVGMMAAWSKVQEEVLTSSGLDRWAESKVALARALFDQNGYVSQLLMMIARNQEHNNQYGEWLFDLSEISVESYMMLRDMAHSLDAVAIVYIFEGWWVAESLGSGPSTVRSSEHPKRRYGLSVVYASPRGTKTWAMEIIKDSGIGEVVIDEEGTDTHRFGSWFERVQ